MFASFKYPTLTLTLLSLLCLGQPATASVVMTGTRLIYPAESKGQTIRLTNTAEQPYLVQIWLDTGDAESTVETADAPFVVSPQIFRMEANAGQMVRLLYTGEALPPDRETVFYLNFSQLPAIRARDQDANKLVLMFRNRLKVFYRPSGLPDSPGDLPGKLTFALRDGRLEVGNPTSYHAVVRHAALLLKGRSIPLAESLMVAPKTQTQWRPERPIGAESKGSARLRLTLVNDYGADVTSELPLD